MEWLYEAVKAFVLGDVNGRLGRGGGAEPEAVPPISERNVVFGAIDPVKNTADTVCSVWPESKKAEDGGGICGTRTSCEAVVTFLCRGADSMTLLRRACRWADAFMEALAADYTLGGAASEASCGGVKYFPDCGAAPGTAAAVEVGLTAYMAENYEEW